jgi:flagellar P-ring protein precursor FlgI
MVLRKSILVVIAIACFVTARQASAVKIRDVARLKNEAPNEIVGMGLVVGLKGTGDGGDFLPAMRPLKEMLKRFDDPVLLERELKNANNVAIVMLSVKIPSEGAHYGAKLDVKVSAIAAKSLKGGRLFISPLIAPRTDVKMVLGSASGDLFIEDETNPTTAIIKDGGVLIDDILSKEIVDGKFTLVLNPNTATREVATEVARTINEEVEVQTDGKPIAVAVDATSVDVTIPVVEQGNPTPFIARLLTRRIAPIAEPAKVFINGKTKTIVFTDEVELAPTMISHGGLTITVTASGQSVASPAGATPFVALDQPGLGNAKLKDLEQAFNLLRVGPEDRIAIVKLLHATNVLKAELVVQ